MSPDSIGLAGGINPHGYVSNPNAWVDPLGLAAKGGKPLLLEGPAALEMTPGGRLLTEHAVERMATPPAGRAAMSAAEVDRVLDGATNIRKISPHPLCDTLTIQNRNMLGSPQVVVDAATGNRVITVINPKIP